MTQQIPTCLWLDKVQYPLVNKFYRAEGERGKVRGDDRCAVIKSAAGEILAAACLRPVDDAELLMGMAVAQKHRGQGYARLLLQTMAGDFSHRTHTFSYSNLTTFYASEGFQETAISNLPEALRRRFISYQDQGRDIVAMQYVSSRK